MLKRIIHMALRWSALGVLVIAACVWAYSALSGAANPFRCRDCNVILISIDTLGAKHTTLGDPTLATTPFLNELAQHGIVFDNAYSQAPWTLPSHVAMLTGRYPWDTDVWQLIDVLPESAETLAETLKKNGYATSAFSDGAFVRPEWGFNRGFDEFSGTAAESAWNDAPKIFNDAETWLAARKTTKPFFLFIRPFEVHDPYEDTKGSIGVAEIARSNITRGGAGPQTIKRYEDAYRNSITTTDAGIRSLVEKINALGLAKRTMIIITADHGEEFGEHGTAGMHGTTVYREVIHVPLLVVLPTRDEGKRVPETVEIRSIPATVLDYLGIKPNPALAPSLLSYANGSEMKDRVVLSATAVDRTVLIGTFLNGYPDNAYKDLAVRTKPFEKPRTISALSGGLQVIRNPDGKLEIYDMRADPDEQVNLDTPESRSTLDTTQVSALIDAFANLVPR